MIATAWLLLARASVLANAPGDGPEPEDVKAGWTAFALFLLLALAVVVLARSLVTQLRKAQRAADSGVYGEPDGGDEGAAGDRPGPRSGDGEDTPDGGHPAP